MATQPKFGWPGLRMSYTCAEAIVAANAGAGVVVERRAGTDLIGNAAAGSNVACGVALDDVPATRASVTGKQVGDGHECTVFTGGRVAVVAAGTITEGQCVIAAANGQVVAAGVAPDTRQVVGRAAQAATTGQTILIDVPTAMV